MFKKSDRNILKSLQIKLDDATKLGVNGCDVMLLKERVKSLEDKNNKLLETLNRMMDLTFESPKSSFETVIFQRYGEKPAIYYQGKRMDLDKAENVDVKFVTSMTGTRPEITVGIY